MRVDKNENKNERKAGRQASNSIGGMEQTGRVLMAEDEKKIKVI